MSQRRLAALTLATLSAFFWACADSESNGSTSARKESRAKVAPPAPLATADAYAAAELVKLPATPAEEKPGLHNVYTLSSNVISGSEPHGEEALRELAARGVKTIVSVDGKEPDAATASRLGMRYVHIPIQYRGLQHDELLALAKTFRELEGPFYVHCFHGKHRGPTGAAVARFVLDGASRQEVLAEMRQWCGTSVKYKGLYESVANLDMPTEVESETFDFDFPAAHPLGGLRESMITIPRAFDAVGDLGKNRFAPDPHQPDLDAANEAEILVQTFGRLDDQARTTDAPEDWQGWMKASLRESTTLRDRLLVVRAKGDAMAIDEALAAHDRLNKVCVACHASYRDK